MRQNYNLNILTFMYYVAKYVYHANQLALALAAGMPALPQCSKLPVLIACCMAN